MLRLLIVTVLVLSVQSSWWWPWPKKDPSQVPFVYYNETTGVETIVTKGFVKELNPFAISLLKLIITGIKIPIPDQKVGRSGLITVHFDDVNCHKLRILADESAPGLYLGDGFVGLSVRLDAQCRSWFNTSKIGFLQGGLDVSLSGVSGNAHVAFTYDHHSQNVAPDIDNIELSFKEVDIKVEHNHVLNGLSLTLKRTFPLLASIAFKAAIKSAIPAMADLLRNFNFGVTKRYHPIFLYPPEINPEKVRLNLALVEWSQDHAQIFDYSNDNINDGGADNLTADSEES